jgi:hypothetical protein
LHEECLLGVVVENERLKMADMNGRLLY